MSDRYIEEGSERIFDTPCSLCKEKDEEIERMKSILKLGETASVISLEMAGDLPCTYDQIREKLQVAREALKETREKCKIYTYGSALSAFFIAQKALKKIGE